MDKLTLAALRVNAGYSQGYVADYCDVAPSTVRNWEKGKTFPKQQKIELLCQLYGVSYDNINFKVPKKA